MQSEPMKTYIGKKHVVLLTDCFGDTQAGAEKQIFELAKGLNKEDYIVTIASLESIGKAPRELVESVGCQLRLFPVRRIYGISGIRQGINFFNFLKREKVSIVQTYHFGSDIWGTFIAHLAGVKVIISNRRDMGFWRRNHHIKAYHWVNQWVTKIVVNAQSIRNYVKETEDIPRRDIEVIYNGVELPEGPTDAVKRSELSVKDTDFLIMHVANLKPVKGHRYLLEALKDIIKKCPNVLLLLIGEDTTKGEIAQLAKKMNVENHVRFLGKRTDVRRLLPLADICVLPSLSEGMSNAILEYMAAGKAVVATRVGGTPEIVDDNVTGILVEKENSAQIRDAILRLIQNPVLRQSMGEAGRKKAYDLFSMPGMVKRYEDFFQSVLPREFKVMHFISSGGFFGAENVLINLVSNMDKNVYHPIVAAIQDGRNPNLQVAERARELKIPVKVFQSKGRMDFDTVSKLRRCLIAHKIDVLHTHNYKSDIIGALAVKNLNVKLISTAHGFTDVNRKVSSYEKLDRWFLKKYFHRIVVVAQSVLKELDSNKKIVIRNGIDVNKFKKSKDYAQETRSKLGIAPTEIVIGTVGRLSLEKNQKFLIDTAAKLLPQFPHLKVIIIGNGPEEESLKKHVRSLGIDKNIIFTGLIKNVVPYYRAFDIFTLTSLTEGVPMTVLEAMAAQTPVVATRVGGIPQIIAHGQTGMLVDSNNVNALASCFSALIPNEALRRQLADAAEKFVQDEYSIERMTNAYSQVYQEALAQ